MRTIIVIFMFILINVFNYTFVIASNFEDAQNTIDEYCETGANMSINKLEKISKLKNINTFYLDSPERELIDELIENHIDILNKDAKRSSTLIYGLKTGIAALSAIGMGLGGMSYDVDDNRWLANTREKHDIIIYDLQKRMNKKYGQKLRFKSNCGL